MASLLDTVTKGKLRDQAAADVAEEINASINPLQVEVGTLESRGAAAEADIAALFAGLQPQVTQSAVRLGSYQNEALRTEQSIFDATRARLDSLAGERAADAQSLAQQIGAPVPVDEFTRGVSAAQQTETGLEGSSLLHALAGGEANVAAAEAYAGRVFPAMRVQEQSRTRREYDEQVNALETQIAQIKSQRKSAVNKRYYDLLLQEKTFQLQKLQANRDYRIAKQTLALQKGELTGKYKGKKTLAAQQLKETKRQFNQQQKLAQQNLNLEMAKFGKANENVNKANRAKNWANALAIAEAALGGSGKSYTTTQWVPAGPNDSSAVERPPGSGQFYKLSNVTQQSPSPIKSTNMFARRNALFKYLLSHGVSRKMAIRAVRVRLNAGKGWHPGVHTTQPGGRGSGAD